MAVRGYVELCPVEECSYELAEPWVFVEGGIWVDDSVVGSGKGFFLSGPLPPMTIHLIKQHPELVETERGTGKLFKDPAHVKRYRPVDEVGGW